MIIGQAEEWEEAGGTDRILNGDNRYWTSFDVIDFFKVISLRLRGAIS